MKVRIQFEKLGAIRFTSHKDVLRIFERCFAAAGVPVAWSEGFHPHVRMSFGPPIRTGWESRHEFMDVQLESPMDGLAEACNAKLPDGFRVVSAVPIDDATPKLATDIAAVTMEVTVEADDAAGSNPESIRAAVTEQFLNTPSADTGEPRVVEAEVVQKEDTIRIRYTSSMQSQRVVTPEALVSATIGDPDSFRVPIKVMRLAQYVARDGRLVSPIDEGVVQINA
ncbi:MAG: TIGR03936 family radical SAM-associated protein [Candidatus Krumholzibacteria bacterium]|nr:TIGR03936 family radical SAM-associated protein [Candidatus Krumholzibacteria bacterium]MDH4336532.1 TIGR03936 family radical SAM-associated protein [Candidatus Krumholzibacteria bacterium]MDH5269613.1 TIGR03936 family radical SAM-associated protein [Candidatus Krumholzibacteria bacterium]